MHFVARERPDVIVVACPCTAFSPMQNLMNQTGYYEKLEHKVKEAMPLVEVSEKLAEVELASGRRF